MSEELTAGPALDALVAEKVMGWGFAPFELDIRDWRAPDGSLHAGVPAYSTDIAAAWQVVESMSAIARTPTGANTRFAYWWAGANLWADTAADAALLICRAALAAVQSEETP